MSTSSGVDRVDGDRLAQLRPQLEGARAWSAGLVDALVDTLDGEDEAQLILLNPIAWASARSFEADEAIALFLHATRVGLLQIHWNVRCGGCGELVATPGGLNQLEHDFYCDSCARSRPTTLDESVEVSFTISPALRSIRFHEPESLSLADYFFDFRFSRNISIRGIDRNLIPFLREQEVILTWLEAGAEQRFELDLPEIGWVVGNPRTMIAIEGEATTELRELSLDYGARAFLPRTTLAPGPVRLTLRNPTDARVRVFLYFTPIVTFFDYLPHLSGHRLLNDGEFRRCLGTDVVRPGTGIPIKDNTLLFTDLRGSTEMYERIGDSAAFALVSQHFEAMAQTITRCGGVVVKTMGDAIMASFNRPVDAMRAALAILDDHAPKQPDEDRLEPKLGVHRGACIVVNQNDMVDYFGQTVNIAARVQGAAGSDELCVTEAVWQEVREDPSLRKALEHADALALEPEQVQLKGVREAVTVYRIRPGA